MRARFAITLGLVAVAVAGTGVSAARRLRGHAASQGAAIAAPEAAPVSLEGTPCALLDAAGTAPPRGPLPDDPALAAWTLRMERLGDAYLALAAAAAAKKERAGDPAMVACVRRLRETLRALPPKSVLRFYTDRLSLDGFDPPGGGKASTVVTPDAPAPARAHGAEPADLAARLLRIDEQLPEEGDYGNVPYLFSRFPDNARLRRALLVQFRASRSCGSDVFEGGRDRLEPMMRATAESWPERMEATLSFLLAADDPGYVPGRLRLDLGPSRNALRVGRDLVAARPEARDAMLAVMRRDAPGAGLRHARQAAFVDYLEAGAPDPGDPAEPGLVKWLGGDAARRRWALAWIPDVFSNPKPIDPGARELLAATVAAAEATEGNDDDTLLAIDVLARAPKGTGLAVLARRAGSENDAVFETALHAMKAQLGPGARREDTHRLFAPHVAVLEKSLGPRVCQPRGALEWLANAGIRGLDARAAPCVAAAQPLDDILSPIRNACAEASDTPWKRTVEALRARSEETSRKYDAIAACDAGPR